MQKFKLLGILGLVVLMSGCLGGTKHLGKSTFTAEGGTFNFFTMKMDFGEKFSNFNVQANARTIAEKHVPSGAKITTVSATPTWQSLGFPLNILAAWNEYIFGFDTVQISGTLK